LKKADRQNTEKLEWTQQHVPISVSIASNATGFEAPVCFVNEDQDDLVSEMLRYMASVRECIVQLARKKWEVALNRLDDSLRLLQNNEYEDAKIYCGLDVDSGSDLENDGNEESEPDSDSEAFDDMAESNSLNISNRHRALYKQLSKLKEKLEKYVLQVPVLGFNSFRYDIALLRSKLLKQLNLSDDKMSFVIKRSNAYCCIATKEYRFLDITQYLAPGCSYSQFLKVFGIAEEKGFFPYDYLDSFAKLSESTLPAYGAFYSDLKGYNVLEKEHNDWLASGKGGVPPKTGIQNYQALQALWREQGMSTFKDYLQWYNNLDCGPFVSAVLKFQNFYKQNNLDVLKISVSLPGIARKMLFDTARENGAHFAVFGTKDEDLYCKLRLNLCGGPSIVFTRHGKAGSSCIRNNPEKLCKRIIGLDCNALYLNSLQKPMPVGAYIRRREENDYAPEINTKHTMMYAWMDGYALKHKIQIQHKLSAGRETRIGPYFLDGFAAPSTAFEVRIQI